jgi:hypothetical protein
MNVERLVAWGQRVLEYLDQRREIPGVPVDGELVEDRLGWLREYRQQLTEWSSLLALAEAGAHYVRHQGLHGRAAEQLRPLLERQPLSPRGARMKDAIVEFVAQQSAAARPGERLIGSTEVLESIIGKYKRLQSMHSAGGMTGMILSLGAIVARRSMDTLRTALSTVTNRDVRQWCRENLGVTLQAQRQLALPAERKRAQPPPLPAPQI